MMWFVDVEVKVVGRVCGVESEVPASFSLYIQ